jgi:penicillin-binding protein 1A
MASAYAVFANSGFRVTPFIIDKIQNSQGQIIYQAKPLAACPTCLEPPPPVPNPKAVTADGKPVAPPPVKLADSTHAPRVISAQNAFLITSALHDVIQFGTATEARSLKRGDLAGKTGTTNNQVDAWFVGYNSDLVALSWVGFDQPQSLHEYGAQAALPIWIDFMQSALKGKPEHTQTEPPDITHVLVDRESGLRADTHDTTALNEVFMDPYIPGQEKAYHPSGQHHSGSGGGSSAAAMSEGGAGIY